MIDEQKRVGFVQRVQDAVEQLRIMTPWDHDCKIASHDWQTFYAVDADVVTTYGSPQEMALRTDGRLGYAQVFASDPPEQSFALAERLVDHIFFELQPQSPLLIIPPIDSELLSILNALTARLGQEPEPYMLDELSLREATKALADEAAGPIPDDILARASALVALRGPSDQTEYRRLTYLLELQRVARATDIGGNKTFPKQLRNVIGAQDSISDMYDHAVLSNEWLDRIGTEGKSSSWRHTSLVRDAYALARLELWNNRLEDAKIRIVYITGALHVIRAAAGYGVAADNFLYKYVRHPRYFLASPAMFKQEDPSAVREGGKHAPFVTNKPSPFFDWILTFLGECKVDADRIGIPIRRPEPESDLIFAAGNAFDHDPHLDQRLQDNWHTYLRKLRSSYETPSLIFHRIRDDLPRSSERSALDYWGKIRAGLDVLIEAEKDSAWDACFRAATRTGLFVGAGLEVNREARPSRLVPPLRFDRWRETDKFVSKMSRWRKPNDISVAEYETGLQAVRYETKGDYPYAYYLAHAALFAARGDWRVGAILATRASTKAVPPDRSSGIGHGREACYLAAYCLRHRARTDGDLDEAFAYLQRATEIYKVEVKHSPSLNAIPERFEAEQLAFELTRLFHCRYRTPDFEGADAAAIAAERESWTSIRARLQALNMHVRGLTEINQSSSFQDCIVRLRSRIAANVLMSSIVLNDLHDAAAREAGELVHKFVNTLGLDASYYLISLDMCWRAAMGDRTLTRKQMNAHFREREVKKHSVLPYDFERYQEIANRTKHLMSR